MGYPANSPMPNLPPGFDYEAAARPEYFPASAGGHAVYSGKAIFLGWDLHSTAGASGDLVYFRDGQSATDNIIAISKAPSAGADVQSTGPRGVRVSRGIFVDDASAVVEGVVWIIPL